MEKIIQLLDKILKLSPEEHIFVIAVLAISVIGFALYVILTVVKSSNNQEG